MFQQPNDHYTTAVSHSTNHILSLLATVANGDSNLVISVLLDRVAPHLPSNSAPWLPGEGPRSTSLEWYYSSVHCLPVTTLALFRSLSVKQQFDQHPLLWHLLLFSTHCKSHSTVYGESLSLSLLSGQVDVASLSVSLWSAHCYWC